MLTIQFTGADGQLLQEELLTSGMVGQTVQLQFDGYWEDLYKTVVFVSGGVCRTVKVPDEDIHMTGIEVTIPTEVLIGGQRLFVGVYGYLADNSFVTPTVMVKGPRVRHGADPTESPDGGNLPVWANLQAQIGQLEELDTQAKDSLVAAINEILSMTPETGAAGTDGADGEDGATFTPYVSAGGVLSWTNNKGLSNPAPVNITGPAGEKGEKGDTGADGAAGADGKSAYSYALDGGYTGSEADFVDKMAREIPTTLPNPQKLTFTGAVSAEYDGSAAVTVSIPSGGGSTGDTAVWTVKELTTTEDLTEVQLPLVSGCEEIFLNAVLASKVKITLSVINDAESSYRRCQFQPNFTETLYRLRISDLTAHGVEDTCWAIGRAGGNVVNTYGTGPYWTDLSNCLTISPYTSGEVIPTGSVFKWMYR